MFSHKHNWIPNDNNNGNDNNSYPGFHNTLWYRYIYPIWNLTLIRCKLWLQYVGDYCRPYHFCPFFDLNCIIVAPVSKAPTLDHTVSTDYQKVTFDCSVSLTATGSGAQYAIWWYVGETVIKRQDLAAGTSLGQLESTEMTDTANALTTGVSHVILVVNLLDFEMNPTGLSLHLLF